MRRTIVLMASLLLALLVAAPMPAHAAGPPAYYPFGPQANVLASQLVGWELCWSSPYGSSGTPTATILADCDGDYLLLGGKPVGSNVFDVVAAGPRADVLFDTGTGNTPHDANGVGWYFSDSYSWGYALAGDPINRSSCDIAGTAYSPGPNGDLRLCWHTGGGAIQGGWRSGVNIELNGSFSFERFIYQPAAVASAPGLPTLTVQLVGRGTGKVTSAPAGISCPPDCSEQATLGDHLTLTATPDAGSVFTGWYGGGCPGTGTCGIAMNGDAHVWAWFDKVPTTTITSFLPASGSVGTQVTITGTNLSGATEVTFGGVATTSMTVDSATQVTAFVPPYAMSGPIVVTAAGGTATSSTDFTVIALSHSRDLSLGLAGATAKGSLSVRDEVNVCAASVPVVLQHLVDGSWRTIASLTTSVSGAFHVTGVTAGGSYRAVATKVSLGGTDICMGAVSPKVRR
jgi:hypothetical protein